jgi:hypothetical protein
MKLHYIVATCILIATSTIIKTYLPILDDSAQETELINKYLLEKRRSNKPMLWIYLPNKILNAEFIKITINSICNTCLNDFNICIINDDLLKELFPASFIDNPLNPLNNPLLQLVNKFGGVCVPKAFLCFKSLLPLYKKMDSGIILTEYFWGSNVTQCTNQNDVDVLIGKSNNKSEKITLDDLFSEQIKLHESAFGILIPENDIQNRVKYNWLMHCNIDDITKSNIAICKLLTMNNRLI